MSSVVEDTGKDIDWPRKKEIEKGKKAWLEISPLWPETK